MIQIKNLNKSFDTCKALDDLSLNVKTGAIYGLIGVNGSGKTTLLKHITGIVKPDSGTIEVDGESVYENVKVKQITGFIPDDLYFFGSYNLNDSSKLYSKLYPNWSQDIYNEMVSKFGLDEKKRLSKFSKGMQKQAAFILYMSILPQYLILDEPIDGLDPLVRKRVWNYIVDAVAEREMTVLVSSHGLREMEGICDSIGIISKGKLLLERNLDELKADIHKVQVSFPSGSTLENPYKGLNILHKESRGAVDLIIVREPRDLVEKQIMANNPVVFDLLPLTLEEIFIYEMGGEDNEIYNDLF